ncbi:MAG: SUMF1/EgtB/PvdO family nonheme iron enzyme [bacterium]|nr:SUMF1/EgtB/PvdO family nonheme iron enzyme [bacterium]
MTRDSEADSGPSRKAFVVWDMTTVGLDVTLDFLRLSPPEGWSVKVGGREERSGNLWSGIEPHLGSADRVVALVDLPNANVGFEVGYGLAKDREVVLGWGGTELPPWVKAPPLDNFVVLPGGDQTAIERLITQAEAFRCSRHPKAGGETLFLCPKSGPGDGFSRWVEQNRGWRVLPDAGWNLEDLPDKLDGVRRVVWLLAPFPEGNDRRDGQENAANAVVAGFWCGLDRELHVWKHAKARDVVDVGREDVPFSSAADFIELVELLDRRVPTPTAEADPLEVYLEYVAEQHRHLPSLFSCDGKDLPDVHVELALGSAKRGGEPVDERHDLLHMQRSLHELLQLTSKDDDRVTRRWAVLGDPGAGKSTACRYLCHALADRTSELARSWPGELPVPVFALLANEPIHPFSLAEREVRVKVGERPAEGIAEALHELAKKPGAVWLFLDGLDELPQERRASARENLQSWADKLEHCVIVVASRTAGFTPIPGFVDARIQPLDMKRQKELIENWLEDESEAAWKALVDRPTLRSLCTNPMLLSLVAYAQSALGPDAQLPLTRHDLYDQATGVLLKRGHGQRPKPVKSAYACRKVLPYLALELMKGGGERWPQPDLLEAVEGLADGYPELKLERVLAPWDGAIDGFLDDVGHNSGLIGAHEGEAQPWRWMHRSIGEYLAADGLNRLGQETYTELATNLEDAARWGEVFGYLCTFAETTAEKLERLQGLAGVSPEIALRALPEVEGLEPSVSFEFLRGLSDWDGDNLLALARGWRAEGHERGEIDELLWRSIAPDLELEKVAYVVYALDGIGVDVSTERLHAKIAERPGAQAPPELDWKACPPSDGFSLEFRMGSEEDEKERYQDEGPAHDVTVEPFQMTATPVTEGQYERFDPTKGAGDRPHPVVGVSWWEAWLFCRWLGGRLPTEVEWEYACRGGTTARYWSGDGEDDLDRAGWYAGNAGGSRHEVKQKLANAFGLYDVHGNVREWVQDRWSIDYSESGSAHPRAFEPAGGSSRVYRGGCFAGVAQFARSACRSNAPPGLRDGALGFRPARDCP